MSCRNEYSRSSRGSSRGSFSVAAAPWSAFISVIARRGISTFSDVEALVQHGEDLNAAIADAPRRDSGFSPLTLAWVLRDLDVRAIASCAGVDDEGAERLDTFRRGLMERLVTPAPDA